MNFSAWSIRRPIPSILLFVVLTLAGLLGFDRLQIRDLPDIDLPAITVGVVLPGATPSQMETEVTRKVENALAGLGQVDHIGSTVIEGASETTLTFRLNKNMQDAMEEVRNALSSIRASLPPDVRDPLISRVRTSGSPILTYAVDSASLDEVDLSWFVDDTLGKTLLSVSGVGQITRQGGVRREVAVELDPTRLKSLNVTAADVGNQILAVQQDAAGGHGRVGGGEQSLRAYGMARSVDDLANLPIPLAGGQQSVRLGDIAEVKDTTSERRNMALLNGKSVVSFQILMAKGASEVDVAARVRAAIAGLATRYPQVHINEVSSTVGFTQQQYDDSMRTLFEGMLLTVVVVWLFLRDWRATAISAVTLPLAVLPAFLVMYLLGYTLNTVTLLALTLVIGFLVDDAIVEVENIERHLHMGKTPFQAALDAADEIGLAVIATSLALVGVFLPMAFIGGASGVIFQQFGLTTSVAVLASLLVARLLTPMMAAYLLKAGVKLVPSAQPEAPAEPGRLMRRYLRVLHWCLAHPRKTSVMAGAFFVLSLLFAATLPEDFIPADDSNEVTVNVTAPPGQTMDDTVAVVEAVRAAALHEPEVQSVFASIGLGSQLGGDSGAGIGDVDNATVLLTLKKDRQRSRQQVEAALRERLGHVPGARFSIGSGDSGEKYSMVLSGDDPVQLQSAALALARDMRGLQGFGNVSTTASLLRPEIVVHRNPTQAADLGVSTLALSQVLRVATDGEYDINLPKLNLPARQVPIRVRLDERSRRDLDALGQLRVPARSGTVPLATVASFSVESGPSRIERYNRSRNITVDMELNGRSLSDAAALVDALPAMKQLPPGVHRVEVGDLESQKELMSNFLFAILAGIVCVYVVLVLLFDDFLQPGTILSAVPLAAGGAFAALWICDFGFSMSSLIGIIMLVGVVTKNSILLVDYAIMAERDEGMSRTDAIVDACRKRARPIMMTTLAMVAGMLPMAFGLNGDASFRAPMAVVVIGGLLSSTVLSLLVVPVVYEMVDGLRLRGRRWFSRRPPKAIAPVPAESAG
ncbi:Multidrug efflux pump subunit AcrB [Andreprevotia lacus DSM 23236]|jgi:multidrug efflux pump subunit AcrB|uniref:Multidrug efflux pump subunit AcrB n=1 Tax=Andreprevotia lacus DSM 23236 TaxID=1121001 RepID=A0A1W1XHX0_9NEIS|nr:efflux RND transporter permease subunit [Andreprevotia lacus]SMC23382.1 Multidrug efflux pump subunit AcrB [Andreprevotia lacus DSM 23236]